MSERNAYDDLRAILVARDDSLSGVRHGLLLIDAMERGDHEREAEIERLREAASFALVVLGTDTTHRGLGEDCGRDACFLCAAEVNLRTALAPREPKS